MAPNKRPGLKSKATPQSLKRWSPCRSGWHSKPGGGYTLFMHFFFSVPRDFFTQQALLHEFSRNFMIFYNEVSSRSKILNSCNLGFTKNHQLLGFFVWGPSGFRGREWCVCVCVRVRPLFLLQFYSFKVPWLIVALFVFLWFFYPQTRNQKKIPPQKFSRFRTHPETAPSRDSFGSPFMEQSRANQQMMQRETSKQIQLKQLPFRRRDPQNWLCNRPMPSWPPRLGQ